MRVNDKVRKAVARRGCLLMGAWLAACGEVLAVSPLVTDDADTVERGHLQLNTGWQFDRTASVSVHSIVANSVFGLHPHGEMGVTFGYQWRNGFGRAPDQSDAGDLTDLTLATKWRLWQTADEGFKLGMRFDLMLPTASERRGLGTGNIGAGVVLIATRRWKRTYLDWNLGYSASDIMRNVSGDDQWFLGQALRHSLTERWTFICETYALLPKNSQGASANVHFSGGAQFTVRENLLLSTLIGSAAGRNSPDLTGYLGFTIMF